MVIIKTISKRIKEEIHDAEWYARSALEEKDQHTTLANLYHRLAEEELGHASMLHDEAVAMIRKISTEKEVPPVMRELWSWQHGEIVEEEAEVRRLIDMYKR